jgi:membrane fusion protein (multidrug efflux system)
LSESNRYERLRQLEMELILADGTVYPHPGKTYAVDREVGATTGALRVEALFPNPDYSLRPGQFARIRLKFDVEHGALLIPQRAVGELQGSFQVAVVKSDDKIHIQPVTVGERTGSMWIIKEGLQPTDRVVVEGIQKVREGTLVTTTNYVAPVTNTPPPLSTK